MMNTQINISTELYEDEIVRFIADRYHTSPREVIKRFLEQEGIIPEEKRETIIPRLEDNEMEILRGLTKECQS